ncbi:acyltransferase [Acidobacteriota bacterium]
MKKKVKISQVDTLFSEKSYPIEFLFYFKEGFDTKKIRAVLRKLSSVFWPMFGEYKDGFISFEKYREEECYDEEVIPKKFDIHEIEEDRFDVYSRYCLPDLKRLFFLKVKQFTNGTILIPKMNHLAGDGYSYFYFLSVLAMLSQKTLFFFKSFWVQFFAKPCHRRTILKDFFFKGIELKPPLQKNRLTIEFEEIPRIDVKSMIKKVFSSDNLRVSTNDILSAMALKKIVGIQSEFFGEKVNLTIPIDVRRQVKEYGRRFFGNGIMLYTLKLKKEYIKNSPAEKIAKKIRKSMPSVSKEAYIKYLTTLEEQISPEKPDGFIPFDPRHGCLVTNISRLPVNNLNFGTGSPELAIPLSIEKNSIAILTKDKNYILRFVY